MVITEKIEVNLKALEGMRAIEQIEVFGFFLGKEKREDGSTMVIH